MGAAATQPANSEAQRPPRHDAASLRRRLATRPRPPASRQLVGLYAVTTQGCCTCTGYWEKPASVMLGIRSYGQVLGDKAANRSRAGR